MPRPPRRKAPSPAPTVSLETQADPVPDPAARPSHVVAIGGSAGSLEAMEVLFRGLPADTGAAFVVCVHREQSPRSLLSELIADYTAMQVGRLASGETLQRNAVYVLPVNRTLTLASGRVGLTRRETGAGQIDELFSAVAADEGPRAIGILLSGMDADGTLGLEAIRAAGGLSLVQDPSTARYDVMPRAAIDAGASDVVDVPERLAERFLQLASALEVGPGAPAAAPEGALDAIVRRVLEHTGHDLTHYKRAPLLRRIQRRMALRQVKEQSEYLALLEREPEETARLFRDLLIGVTRFFREPDVFSVLAEQVLPRILAVDNRVSPLRVWIAGCSTGEEAYSVAMVAREALDALPAGKDRSLQVYATDLDQVALERARVGQYPKTIATDVTPKRLAQFFLPTDGGYRVSAALRSSVVFATHDLTAQPPFTRLDLVCCRNVLIYLSVEAQRRLLALFHFALRAEGVLVLGGSESLAGWERAFQVVDAKARVFRRRELAREKVLPMEFPARGGGTIASSPPERPLAAHAGRQETVRELVRMALEELGGLTLPGAGKKAGKGARGQDATVLEGTRRRLGALAETLETVRREAQFAHEELQSTNEELQSTNEELVTAREETQSMNEELLTLNAELSAKNEALELVNVDMRNVLDGSQIPTLFLDESLRIRRFTSQASRIGSLRPGDVGRPLSDIVLAIDYEMLEGEVRDVLRTHVPSEHRVRARDGSTFTMRIHPYQTVAGSNDGVVITFIDVTALAREIAEGRVAARDAVASAMVRRWPSPAYVLEPGTGRCVAINLSARRTLGYAEPQTGQDDVHVVFPLRHPDDGPDRAAAFEPVRLRHADGSYERHHEHATWIEDDVGEARLLLVELGPIVA